MKHLKLFENFTAEENPTAIEIELTDKFIDRMKLYKMGTKPGFALNSQYSKIKLYNNGTSYNMVMIGRVRSDEYDFSDKEQNYWISYWPDNDELNVNRSITTRESRDKFGDLTEITLRCNNDGHELKMLDMDTAYYVKFKNGFKVGEVSDEGYFKIVGIEK